MEELNKNLENEVTNQNATPEQQKGLSDTLKLMEEIAANAEITEENVEEVDELGFKPDGINIHTGTIYDEEGYDKDGFDDIGVDREGFDRNGFGSDGRDREGYDENGFNKDGYDRNGYDRNGYDKEGYDRSGYNRKGVDAEGFDRKGFDSEGYDRKGFNKAGKDRDGFDRNGINELGVDRFGFNREGINVVTGTNRDEEGFNKFGVDENGYDRDGKLDKSVEFALEYIAKDGIPMSDFAQEKGVQADQMRSIIHLAKEKVPELTNQIDEMVNKAQSRRYAAVRGSVERDIKDQMLPEEFWRKHPRLDIQTMANIVGKETMLDFVNNNIALVDTKNQDSIHYLAHIFCSGKPDAKKTIEGIDYVQKIIKTEKPESEEDKKKQVDRIKRLYALRKFVEPHKNVNLNDLRDGLTTIIKTGDSGEIRHQVTNEDVKSALQTLNERNQLVSRGTVLTEIRKNIK